MSLYDYYNHAGSGLPADSANHEVKLTDSGRTVYGGGGITPDEKIEPPKTNRFQDEEIFLKGSTGTQGGGNAEFVLGWPGAGRPGYPHAEVQFPSGSGAQADFTAGVYVWRAGSTGSGTVVLSGKSGSLNLEMTPYSGTTTPSPEHVQGRWQCP